MDSRDLYEQLLEQDLCKKCHQRRIDRTENRDSVLCRECRQELIKLKIPPLFYVLAVITLALFLITVAPLSGFGGFKKENINQLVEEGYILSAMEQLTNDLAENPDNYRAAVSLADIAMEYSYYDYAAYAINNYLTGVSLSDSNYYKLEKYVKEIKIYYETLDKIQEIYNSIFNSTALSGSDKEQSLSEDRTREMISDYIKEISSYIGNDSYNQAYLYYNMAYMMQDTDQRLSYLEKCVECNPHAFEAISQIAVIYRSKGQLDKAREIIEAAYNVNKQDYSLLRAYATIELVEGNTEAACSYAYMAWNAYPKGVYVADTYLVALTANGQQEEAQKLLSECEEQGYVFDDDFYQYMEGKITLEEYYK